MHVAAGDKKGKERRKANESSVNEELRTSKIQKRNCYPLRGGQGGKLRRKSGQCGLCGIKTALVNLDKACPFFKWVIMANRKPMVVLTKDSAPKRPGLTVHEDLEKPRNFFLKKSQSL